jgi:hypothetical protein
MRFVVLVFLAAVAVPATPLPSQLADTGLYAPGSTTVRGDNMSFSPQYPLWSDGTRKRRWLYLPPGTAIDASRPDAWEFPPGTKAWKEFSYDRRIETRLIERLPDGSWRFAAYVWNAEQTAAVLVPERGSTVAVAGAPGGRYRIPSRADCLACHEGAAVPLLGASALQLSPDRDPLAPHAEPRRAQDADLRSLAAQGRLRNLPRALLEQPPRIAAATPIARAALGYLHANCGHCHNDVGPLTETELVLAQAAAAPAESVAKIARSLKLAGRSGGKVLVERMQSINPYMRMPPLGVSVVDGEGAALVSRWMSHHFERKQEETSP